MAKGGKRKRKGRFIVFEGIDGAGTTTQVAATVEWLERRGELVHATREPTTGPIGTMIRHAIGGRLTSKPAGRRPEPVDPATIALLFAADRLDHLQNEIIPHLEAGRHVVCDRYVLSSLAYQSVDVDLRFVRAINGKALAPDITFFLEVTPEVAMGRVDSRTADKDSFETLGFQRQVAKAYELLLQEYRDGRVETLDGEAAPGTVSTRVRAALEELV